MSPPEPGGLRAGDVLARRYDLVEPIAAGGMSVIWRAFDRSLQRQVAVKVLDGELGSDRGDRELIRREARATARLIHPDAIEVYDYGETVTTRGRLAAYVVMRLLEGRPLADRIAEGPLPWREAAAIAARLAAVLATAHARGIVHRDVTAENVLLTADGAKLLDFGIAAFIGEGDDDHASDYGTPPYVAPERLTGTTADPAGDVYALGVLLFEMLTGGPPYPERTWEEIENARREGPPPEVRVPGLPSEIAVLCRSCLSADPAERPKAREVADRLSRPPSRTRTAARTVIVRWTLAAAAVVLAAGALTWYQALGTGGQRSGPGTALGPATRPVPSATPRLGASPTPGRARSPGSPSPVSPDRSAGSPDQPAGLSTPPTDPPDRSAGTPDGSAGSPERSPGAGEPPRADRTARVWRSPPDRGTPETAPVAEVPPVPDLEGSVRGFNALLAEGQSRGGIRPDVALDLRQVLDNVVCCSGDLSAVREKIDTRHREGALSDGFRDALRDQLRYVALALTG
ncbi:serine/threonine-protein kinase [Streptosporangium pseudovulgare]|uniref:non-specific serine/threonine protein kinase n=1 Tax=Streptosporangium pseudovulgare TaxID=35765 RepID=A0ABQ2QZ82_9ACTN|nr:serine/threonine-protein kinase [Streptosporangium pseudovulgare]GGQ04544.1 serine/threonine protein kinase [Streptosporangium pseudovulgare]